MKKRLALILFVILFATCCLTACKNTYKPIEKLEGGDPTAIVYSNGKSVVAQGDYIYFVNGYQDTYDSDGTNNIWGEVKKGALCRVKASDFSDFKIVVPKLITMAANLDGGFKIIDEWIYYSTPHSEKDKYGYVNYLWIDFMRTKIDGSQTELIYTVEDDFFTGPYNYYKINDKIYLVYVITDSDNKLNVYSVEVGVKNAEPKNLVSKADKVVLGDKEVYDPQNTEIQFSDYIFYQRELLENEKPESGNVICKILPDGTDNNKILKDGRTTYSLIEFKNEVLYFSKIDSTYNREGIWAKMENQEYMMTAQMYDAVEFISPEEGMFAVLDNVLYYITYVNSDNQYVDREVVATKIYDGNVNMYFSIDRTVDDKTVRELYFVDILDSDNEDTEEEQTKILKRINVETKEVEDVIPTKMMYQGFFNPDYYDGYIFYYESEETAQYLYRININNLEDYKIMGEQTEEDLETEE